MSRTHTLKTWPEPFAAIKDGRKRFEYRKNDRGYAVGDVIDLTWWEPMDRADGGYYDHDQVVRVIVTYITHGFGIPEGYCVMSFERVDGGGS